MERTCSIDGCTRPLKAKGLCSTHWWRDKHGKSMQVDKLRRSKSTCSVEGCSRETKGAGLCGMHYHRMRKNGEVGSAVPKRRIGINEGQCSARQCEKPAAIMGLCSVHYRRERLASSPACAVEGCTHPAESRGWCSTHYRRWQACGDPGEAGRRRAPAGSNKGLSKQGYPWHYDPVKRTMVLEHRFVMEAFLGRPLARDENVHHLNGDRTDYRLRNLELWSTSQPCGQRIGDKVKWAREIIDRYGDDFDQGKFF